MYCIDTSALIAAWVERYPPENFPPLWRHLDQLISRRRISAPPEVLGEVEKKSDELHAWLKQRERALVTPYDDDFLLAVRTLLRRFPRLVMEKSSVTRQTRLSSRWPSKRDGSSSLRKSRRAT